MNQFAFCGSLDPCLPLAGDYFHQIGQTTWRQDHASALTDLLRSESPPEFRTVLGRIGEHWTGPLYADFDSPDLGEACTQFQKFILKLEALGVDLECVRMFASGSKGFHIEVPQAVFLTSVPVDGVADLPMIYREMVWSKLFVDTIDLCVYSQGKGRMWRVPNRQRSNGAFKVPLTVAEAMTVNAETYAKLVASPRPFPTLKPAVFSSDLALAYSLAVDAVKGKKAVQAKRRIEPTVLARQLKQRFGAKLPPTIGALGQGLLPTREGKGWNEIALQVACVAQATGLTEDATVAAFSGLINRHQSDSRRYCTPRLREAELRRMFDYLWDSPYTFTIGGIRSILPPGVRCAEFRGLGL